MLPVWSKALQKHSNEGHGFSRATIGADCEGFSLWGTLFKMLHPNDTQGAFPPTIPNPSSIEATLFFLTGALVDD
jgi:hypothetical protein